MLVVMQATAQFTKGRLTGDLTAINSKTIWMRLDDGTIVKRHRSKRHVKLV